MRACLSSQYLLICILRLRSLSKIFIDINSNYGENFRHRLSALAKAQGGEDAPARTIRNKLVAQGLSKKEYHKALDMLQDAGY